MISPKDVHSLSDFQRNAKKMLKDLKKSKRPALLTVNGKGTVVVQDAAAYEEMISRIDDVLAHAKIRAGLEDVRAGRTRPLSEVAEELKARAAALDRPRRRKSA
jgi:prevent-host-death family protein